MFISTPSEKVRSEKLQDLQNYALCTTLKNGLIASICAFFTPYMGGILLLQAGAMELITNIAIKALFSAAEYAAHIRRFHFFSAQRIRQAFDYCVPLSSMFFGVEQTSLCLVHELGHATTAKALFLTSPKVHLSPFHGGKTSYTTSQLTTIGRWLGTGSAKMWVLLGGPLFSMLFAVGCFLAEKLYQSAEERSFQQNVAECCSSLGFSALWAECKTALCYALSPKTSLESDYRILSERHQISPLLMVSSMIGVFVVSKKSLS
ncbi:MAG: hypothetical protein AAGI90_03840 [Chlamydiota bacterium]